MRGNYNSAAHQLHSAALEWIEKRPHGTTFHVSDLYRYVRSNLPELCSKAGAVSSGELRETNTPRYALWDSKKRRLIRNGSRRGYWERL